MKKSSIFSVVIMLACICAGTFPTNANPFYSNPSSGEQIRSNLYVVAPDNTATLLDGDLTQYDQSYSNLVDGLDARKMSNFSENIGMLRGSTTLVIERRHTIDAADTIFYKLWNTQQQRNYQLEFVTVNLDHPGLAGHLEDSYLHTSVPINLNGSNYFNFSVTSDPASTATDRFRIVFGIPAPGILPLTFTSVKAYQQNKIVNVDWKTENEWNMKLYNVEKSLDGKHFSSNPDVIASNKPVNNYSWTDAFPAEGYNYYRIRSTDISGVTKYSEILKVFSGKAIGDIKVFPNPVVDNTIHLQILNQPEGLYDLKLVNNSGQVVMTKQVQHAPGTGTETIRPSQQIPRGIYQLEVSKPDGSKTNIHLVF